MRKTHIVFIVAAMLALQGCQSTAHVTAAETQSQSPVSREGQTLWNLVATDGKKSAYLQDDDPDVQAIRRQVVLHSGIVDNRNPGIIGESIAQEFDFYSQGFAQKLMDEGYEKAAETHFHNSNIHSRQSGVAWYASTISDERTRATANFETTFAYTDAAPQYLAANGLKLNLPYTQHRKITLEKSDGRWQITDIQKSGLAEAKEPPAVK